MWSLDASDAEKAISQLQDDLDKAAREAVTEALQAAEADAKATTLFNDKTGLLRRSIKSFNENLSGVLLAGGPRGSDVEHASFIENGTPPHVISANKAKMLRFFVNGGVMFRRSVNHPGTAPRPFMEHAEFVGQVVFDNAAEENVERAIQRANRR